MHRLREQRSQRTPITRYDWWRTHPLHDCVVSAHAMRLKTAHAAA